MKTKFTDILQTKKMKLKFLLKKKHKGLNKKHYRNKNKNLLLNIRNFQKA